MHTIELARLPWGELAIAGDDNMIPRALKLGSIRIDSLAGLPEVAAIQPGDVVLDCGAFIGDNTVEFVEKGATVHAFEPFFDACVCIRWNAPAAIVHNMPVGDGRTVQFAYDCPSNNKGMRKMITAPDGLKTLRIDDLNFERVNFLKLDVEGFEIFALDGMADTIHRCRPILYVEVFPTALKEHGCTPEDLEAKLRSFDYELRFVGELPRWDWMCIPK